MTVFSLLERYRPAFAPDGPTSSPGGAEAGGGSTTSGATEGGGAASETSTSDSSLGFEEIPEGDDLDVIEIEAEPSKPSAEAEAQPKPEEAAPGKEPKEPPKEAKTEPKAGEQEPKPQAEPSKPAADGGADKPFLEQLKDNRPELIEALAKKAFVLSEDDIKELELDLTTAVPKLLARTYFDAVHTMLGHMQNLVPSMIDQHMSIRSKADEVVTGFYGQFKGLDRSKHHADVEQFARAFRQANPQIDQEGLNALVGAAVMAKHGLSMPAASNGAEAPGSQQPKPAPFVPAKAGAVVRVTPEAESEFAGMGRDYDE